MHRISRRTVLTALGSTIGLPWLESMNSNNVGQLQSRQLQNQRIAFMYVPNGVIGENWFPEESGKDYRLPATLLPLKKIKEQLVVISGLNRTYTAGADPHSQSASCWLTSSLPNESVDGIAPINTTLDRMIAHRIGNATPFPSLELSCNSYRDNREPKMFDAISWYGPGHDARAENDPAKVFQRMFGSSRNFDGSVLDSVREEAAELKKLLSKSDKEKLDEYFQSVRQIENQIQKRKKLKDRLRRVSMIPPSGIPEDRGEYIRMMGDLMILAFKLNLTRVATMMVAPERWDSPQMYHGVFDKPVNHHSMTHDNNEDENVAKIDLFHVRQFSYLVNKMASIREGESTMLDNTFFVYGSGLGDGYSHSYKQLPMIIAGGKSASVQTDRHLVCKPGTPLANLWLTIGKQMGLDLKRFADSTEPLSSYVDSTTS